MKMRISFRINENAKLKKQMSNLSNSHTCMQDNNNNNEDDGNDDDRKNTLKYSTIV